METWRIKSVFLSILNTSLFSITVSLSPSVAIAAISTVTASWIARLSDSDSFHPFSSQSSYTDLRSFPRFQTPLTLASLMAIVTISETFDSWNI